MTMKQHPNKHIKEAIAYALANGWHYVESGSSAHAFCRLRCNFGHAEHQMSIWSTPKNAENHAKQIVRKVNQCQVETIDIATNPTDSPAQQN